MPRQTRSGAQFSPYELDRLICQARLRDAEVIPLDFSLDASLQESMRAAEARAAEFEEQAQGPSGDDEWEGDAELCSGTASPLSSLSTSPSSSPCPSSQVSRPHSPTTASPAAAATCTSPLHQVAAPTAVPGDIEMLHATTKSTLHCNPTPCLSRPPSPTTASPAAAATATLPLHDNFARTAVAGGIEKLRAKTRSARHRTKTRQRNAQSPYARPSKLASQKHREGSPVALDSDIGAVPSSSGGAWLGPRFGASGEPRTPGLPELVEAGCRVIKWNGRDPKLLVDTQGRIVAILLGQPEDPDWGHVIAEAVEAMHRARVRAHRAGMWSPSAHRHGRFMAIAAGVSFGGGQKRPGNLVHSRFFRRIVRRLLHNRHIRRIAGFQSSGFAMFAPKLYRYFCTILALLFEHHPDLTHNFTNSVFPATTLNCGPDAVTFNHLDHLNLSHGFCAITCGGKFDHTRSAALHLRTWNLAIECPSASTFLIPSAIVEHGNTSLQQGETRHSITQYAAGGLFRWVTYGFQSLKSLLSKEGGAQLRASFDEEPGSRWGWALGLFSKIDELEADRADVFCQRKSM